MPKLHKRKRRKILQKSQKKIPLTSWETVFLQKAQYEERLYQQKKVLTKENRMKDWLRKEIMSILKPNTRIYIDSDLWNSQYLEFFQTLFELHIEAKKIFWMPQQQFEILYKERQWLIKDLLELIEALQMEQLFVLETDLEPKYYSNRFDASVFDLKVLEALQCKSPSLMFLSNNAYVRIQGRAKNPGLLIPILNPIFKDAT